MVCLLAVVLTTALYVTGASAAKAKTTKVEMIATCESVTFKYSGFPNAPNNTVSEVINVNGSKIKNEKFVFNGPTGENTVAINLPSGTYTLKTTVTWNTNGIKGESATKKTQIVCKAAPKPEFTIEKLQKIEGEPGFTKSELSAKDGRTVDYEIIVKNTGNVPLTFKPLVDTKCEGISPSGEVTIAAGGSETYTCHHVLAGPGSYTNTATIEGNEGTGSKTSNEVVVKIAEPSFTIEKLQKIEGEPGFTQLPLSGKDGQTVEYEIIVKNTGNVTLKFKPLVDAKCTGISPSGEVTILGGGAQTYTCHHLLSGSGTYTNTASIEGNEETGSKTSNEVIVNIASEPKFTIEKLQEIEGSKAGFTKSELTGKDGQTVDYEVIVKNTGNISLKFKPLSDPGCEGISPNGEVRSRPAAPRPTPATTCSRAPGPMGTPRALKATKAPGRRRRTKSS